MQARRGRKNRSKLRLVKVVMRVQVVMKLEVRSVQVAANVMKVRQTGQQ